MTTAPTGTWSAPPRTRRAAKLGPAHWIMYGVSVLAIEAFATQLYFFVQIGIWNYMNPGETAFMRSDAWTLQKTHPGSRCNGPGCLTRFRAT